MRYAYLAAVCGAALLGAGAGAFADSESGGAASAGASGSKDIGSSQGQIEQITPAQATAAFLRNHARSAITHDHAGALSRVYGQALAQGATPVASAEAFLADARGMLGLQADDLRPEADHLENGQTVPVMFDRATGQYKFTAVYYNQYRGGVPVHGSRLTLLVRNEPGYPLVLANTDVRELGNFDPRFLNVVPRQVEVLASVQERFNAPQVVKQERVIWAGLVDQPAPPRLADRAYLYDGAEEWLVITDAITGEILHEEFLICFIDVEGVVDGVTTEGIAADICSDEIPQGLPYLHVTANGFETVTDAFGNFAFFGLPADPVTLEVTYDGIWFDVFDFVGAVESLSAAGVAGAENTLRFNSPNAEEFIRAQANAYLQSNVVRDFALMQNPAYPTLTNQDFPVTVNRTDQFCPGNAWYSPLDNGGNGSINFCQNGEGHPNTAWSSVIHHEFGHHLVNAGGSGQGAYGEGMGDVLSLLILDSPALGQGFTGDCGTSLRTADNTFQYPCSGSIHFCGQLISGCVWSTRNELAATNPSDYLEILANLAVNSILVHSGSSINPSITVDYLTLDDDNGNIFDGTPHYAQIAAGFGAHNMDAPELQPISINFPDGRPNFVAPDGSSDIDVFVTEITGTVQAGQVFITYDLGDGPVTEALANAGGTNYVASIPGGECGSTIEYYFSATDTEGATVTMPVEAPAETYLAYFGFGSDVEASDDFEVDNGWTTENLSATAGLWERGVPVNDGGWSYDPTSDSDGSGQCWLTGNSTGNTDIDDGAVRLTSPVYDMSQGELLLHYDYFLRLTNENGTDRLLVEANDGSGWVTLVVHVTNNALAWTTHVISQDDWTAAGLANTANVQLRFTANDASPQSVVEAGLDHLVIEFIQCEGSVEGDLTGDGLVNVFDLLELLANWGTDGAGADLAPADDIVNLFDLLELLSLWS